jgi:hypothetical protein
MYTEKHPLRLSSVGENFQILIVCDAQIKFQQMS